MLNKAKKQKLESQKKILIDQLKIMDLYPYETLKYFGSQKEILLKIDEILDEILKIEQLLKSK